MAIVDERERETVFLVRRTLDAAGLEHYSHYSHYSFSIPPADSYQADVGAGRAEKGKKEREGKARLNAMSERLALRTHTAAAAAVLLSRPSIPSATTIPVTGTERERTELSQGIHYLLPFPLLEKTKNQPTSAASAGE